VTVPAETWSADMGTAGTYVYAVGRGRRPSSFACIGVDGPRSRELRAVSFGDLWAVASDAPRGDIDVTRANIQAHSDAVQDAFAHADAVLPLHFGTVYPDDDTVRADLLGGHLRDLQLLLDRVEHRAEMRLKAYYDDAIALREIVAEHRGIRELDRRTRSVSAEAGYYDRIRLGELVARAVDAKRVRDAAAIVSRLAPLAVESILDDRLHGDWAVTAASFLVERTRLDKFGRAVETLGRDLGARVLLRCVGPLPPYSFTAAAPNASTT